MAYKRPRGKCRYCLRTFSLNPSGRLRYHTTRSGAQCSGSGTVPA